MAKIRVLICDDQAVVREGLELILSADPGIDVAGLAADGQQAIELAALRKPDVVLMDLNMPVVNGIQATERICRELPQTKVLVLTTFGEDEWVFDAIRAGAAGYLLKGTPGQEVIAAVKGTHAGKSYIDPDVGGRLLKEVGRIGKVSATNFAPDLSERELGILKLIAKGMSNAEISKHLHITQGTVRNYVSAVLEKLEVKDRTQAALAAIRYGLVE